MTLDETIVFLFWAQVRPNKVYLHCIPVKGSAKLLEEVIFGILVNGRNAVIKLGIYTVIRPPLDSISKSFISCERQEPNYTMQNKSH